MKSSLKIKANISKKKNNILHLGIIHQLGSHPGISWMRMKIISKTLCELSVGQVWILKIKSWIHRQRRHQRCKLPCAIIVCSNQWREDTNKRAIFILIHRISKFLLHIWSILWNTHEAITQIIKTILQEVNSTDGLDAIIDRIFRWIEKGVTYSPVLAIFDPDKSIFFKTDWSAEGMGFTLMQTTDDE